MADICGTIAFARLDQTISSLGKRHFRQPGEFGDEPVLEFRIAGFTGRPFLSKVMPIAAADHRITKCSNTTGVVGAAAGGRYFVLFAQKSWGGWARIVSPIRRPAKPACIVRASPVHHACIPVRATSLPIVLDLARTHACARPHARIDMGTGWSISGTQLRRGPAKNLTCGSQVGAGESAYRISNPNHVDVALSSKSDPPSRTYSPALPPETSSSSSKFRIEMPSIVGKFSFVLIMVHSPLCSSGTIPRGSLGSLALKTAAGCGRGHTARRR